MYDSSLLDIYRSEYPQHKVRYYYCYNGQSRQEQGKMLVRCVVQYAEMSIGSKYIPMSGKTVVSSQWSVAGCWVWPWPCHERCVSESWPFNCFIVLCFARKPDCSLPGNSNKPSLHHRLHLSTLLWYAGLLDYCWQEEVGLHELA